MKTIIHSLLDIVVGKLYITVAKTYRNNTVYLGCINNDTHEKFLVIVVDEMANGYYVGKTVVKPDCEEDSLWTKGFEEQTLTH